MIKKVSWIIFTFLVKVRFVFAQCPDGSTDGSPNCIESTSVPSQSIELINPLKNGGIDDIPTLVERILDIVLKIGVPIIVLAIIYAGFKFVAAQGKPDKLEEAKRTFVYVLLGSGILLGAYAIATAVVSTITAIRG